MRLRLTALCLLAYGFFSTSLTAQTTHPDYLEGEIYVKYIDTYVLPNPQDEVEGEKALLPGVDNLLVSEMGLYKSYRPFLSANSIALKQTYRVFFSQAERTQELIDKLAALPFIEYAERIPYDVLGYTPNDLGANNGAGQYSLYNVKAREAWDISKGDPNITVAIVDDGMRIFHTDLIDNVWRNPGEIAGNKIDDDGNGYVDDVNGYDVGDKDPDPVHPSASFTHGTHVGGIAGATTDNGKGVASIGFNISILPVKCTNDGQSSTQSIPFGYEGINYAVSAGAKIINCSWSSTAQSQTNLNVVSNAIANGCIIVAAASNDGLEQIKYPCGYAGVLCIASLDADDSKSGFSNYGSWVDVSAPGAAIYSTVANTNVYYYLSGTSMSTPLVAGLLGLMKSHNPLLSNSQLEQCLLSTADNVDSKNGSYVGKLGSGRINAQKAMQCVDATVNKAPKAIIQSSAAVTCPAVQVQYFASSSQGIPNTYKWYFPGGTPATSTVQNPVVTYAALGKYDVSLVLTNAQGKDSITEQNYMEADPTGVEVIYSEDFATGSLTAMGFTIENSDSGTTWAPVTVNGASSGNRAVRMNFYNYTKTGEHDGLITPVIDMSGSANVSLTFEHAYRRQSASRKDSLLVYVSTDGGATFPHLVAQFTEDGKLSFATKSDLASSFSPANYSDWCYGTLTGSGCKTIDLSKFGGESQVAIKFEAINRNGNNLFIDNIVVSGQCSRFNTSKPEAAFKNNDTGFCLPQTVKFTDNSKNFPTLYEWYFEGGTPSFSTDKNPEVTYNAPGNFDVKLVTTNAYGADSVILNDYIDAESVPVITVNAGKTTLCKGESTTLQASGAKDYFWSPAFGISSSTGENVIINPPSSITYNLSGTSINGCTGYTTVSITVLPGPGNTTITWNGSILTANNSNPSVNVQWLLNGNPIDGETSRTIKPTNEGNYGVKVTDTLGCSNNSFNFLYTTGLLGISGVEGDIKITLYPNPASGQLFIGGLKENVPAVITMYDVVGRKALETDFSNDPINISSLTSGVYFVSVQQEGNTAIAKIIVE